MKNILTSVAICWVLSIISGCCPCEKKAEKIMMHRPFPMTLIYQKTVIDDISKFPVMKKADLNCVQIKSVEEFVKLFERPEELYNVKVEELKPENPRLHGKIFTANQKINDVEVYAAYVKVQTFANGLIRSVEYSFSEDGRKIVSKAKTFPENVKKLLVKDVKNSEFSKPVTLIYDPVLANDQGKAVLVWLVDVNGGKIDGMRYFISQENNKIVYKSTLSVHDLKAK
ncbi:MAG: hypothetical protein IJC27_02440 [Lentisphaeria bacterium]|nr:hypothetical protein [Lentisphaeria bacterium]